MTWRSDECGNGRASDKKIQDHSIVDKGEPGSAAGFVGSLVELASAENILSPEEQALPPAKRGWTTVLVVVAGFLVVDCAKNLADMLAIKGTLPPRPTRTTSGFLVSAPALSQPRPASPASRDGLLWAVRAGRLFFAPSQKGSVVGVARGKGRGRLWVFIF